MESIRAEIAYRRWYRPVLRLKPRVNLQVRGLRRNPRTLERLRCARDRRSRKNKRAAAAPRIRGDATGSIPVVTEAIVEILPF